jgi:hypothetical protein
MLTQNEISFTEEVRVKIQSNPEFYKENLTILGALEENPSLNPMMHYVKESLEAFQYILLMLSIVDKKEEFTVNAYYYLLDRTDFYRASGLQEPSAKEKAKEDLLEILKAYEQKEFAPGN